MKFKRLAREWRKDLDDLASVPFNFVKGQVVRCSEQILQLLQNNAILT